MFDDGIRLGSVTRSDFYYPSSLAGEKVHALRWDPEGDPVGVVQLIHGMEEHISRYDDFARFLAMRGYVVCGESHIGHGKTAPSPERLSCLPENGAQVMLSDVHTLRSVLVSEFGDLPYFMLGHSMGSYILRVYLSVHGKGLAGAVVCGTGQENPVAVRFANWLARRIGTSRGFDHKSLLLDKLVTGSYSKAVDEPRTHYDWLSCDPLVVDEYIADPECGVTFSTGGYASLTDLVARAAQDSCAGAVPRDLPVLFIAGAQDPVGSFGKGVQDAADAMQRCAGNPISLILYDGMRHEILNEPDRMTVYSDVLDFLQSARKEACR